jgi:glycolate oxidase
MLSQKIIRKFSDIVGEKNITINTDELDCYSFDGSGVQGMPEIVIFPGRAKEISQIMTTASEYSIPVVARGAGTGMTGGAVPVRGGIVLAMARFNRIIEIDKENQIAIIEPGVITGVFQKEVARLGLFYPPDPASSKFCSIGGNIGECAGGPSAVKYGVTRDYVLGLEVVLANGKIINTGGKTAKGVVGYDLTRLFIGSEGTLGIITRVIVKLLTRPEARETFQVLSNSLEQATTLVGNILAKGFVPTTIEYIDYSTLKTVSAMLPEKLPGEVRAMLLIELDGDLDVVRAQSRRLAEYLKQYSLISVKKAENQEETELLWAARKAISPSAFKLKPDKLSEDIVVPRSKISKLVDFAGKIARKYKLIILTFGHAGDGNIHVNIMLDKKDPLELAAALEAKEILFKEVLRLSGTLSGEHGVGVTKSNFIGLELSKDSLDLMKKIKIVFDPDNILNPGKIFPG